MPRYRLELSCSSLPHNTNLIYAIMKFPPLDYIHYFCDFDCLKKWLAERDKKIDDELKNITTTSISLENYSGVGSSANIISTKQAKK
jgi:hypothetical protein